MFQIKKVRPVVHRIRHQHEIAGWLFVLLLLLFGGSARAQELPFRPGESLLFSGRWLFFDAGMFEANVTEGVQPDGRPGLRFVLHTWTTNVISKIFTMDDHFDSLWDPENRLPVSMKAVIRESTTTKDKLLEFDHSQATASVTQDDKPRERFPLNPGAQDVFSAAYLIRATPLTPGQKLHVPVFENSKNYFAEITVAKRERIAVLDGQVDTIMLVCRLKFEGAFTDSNRLYVWLTDDEYKVPVRLRINMTFGDIILSLVKVEGTGIRIIRNKTASGALVEKQ